jgi:Domain of unknown function (DUF6973)
MNLWLRIKKLSIPSLIGFGWILIRSPLLIVPVYKVTQRTMQISDERYGRAHFYSGKANAFRHALWNYLLCNKVHSIINDPIRSVSFTERLVNYYEKVTQNDEMDRTMDRHNNEFGRNVFLSKINEKEQNMIDFIHNRAETGQKITNIDDFGQFSEQLVYLHEDD